MGVTFYLICIFWFKNSDLLQGFGNIFGSFFSCLPFTASLSRSLIQHAVGGKTQLASVVSCSILVLILLYIGPFFEPLPHVSISPEYLRLAYLKLFMSHMYSSFVDDILVLHQSALYNIVEANPLTHSKLLFVELNSFTIVNLYILQVLSHKKSYLDLIPVRQEIHQYCTKGRNMIGILPYGLTKTKSSFKLNSVYFLRSCLTMRLATFLKIKLYDYLVRKYT